MSENKDSKKEQEKELIYQNLTLGILSIPNALGLLWSIALFLVSLLFSEWMHLSEATRNWVILISMPTTFSLLFGINFLISTYLREPIRIVLMIGISIISLLILLNFQIVQDFWGNLFFPRPVW